MDAVKVTPEMCFTGFDACEQLLQTDVDIVILATPPVFRPSQIQQALEAGKHLFAEKPVSVDPAGTRSVFESVEYTYPNGAVGHASSRQNMNCSHRLGERIRGTKGTADPYAGIEGENPYKYPGPFDNPRFIQWRAFIDGIRNGNPINNGKEVTEASMTAILGRMCAYTGRSINYGWALQRSELDFLPEKLELGPHPVEPLAIPGITELV